ncbi:hypothetical protein [Nocardioides sp. SYSU DS0651]|uniref:hypothetical protein n=1 Tax=Nocardioides sp. SYSU DS0651 TaxID=3415955 RepID=UPI003F4CAA48
MPGVVALLRAAVAAGVVLAAAPLTAPTAAAGEAVTTCASDEVTVVVDFNELGGRTRVACSVKAGTAAHLFRTSGFPLTYTRAPGMQGFVCSVSGKPEKGPCTQGTAYWSLWWSDDAGEWTYATLGADQLEVPRGGYVGFAWHQGDVDAAPPDVVVADGGLAAGAGEQVAEGAPEPAADSGEGGFPPWAAVALGLVVLGAAAAVPLARRRSS